MCAARIRPTIEERLSALTRTLRSSSGLMWLLIALVIYRYFDEPTSSSESNWNALGATIAYSWVVWWLALVAVGLIATLALRRHGVRRGWTIYAAATGAALGVPLSTIPLFRLIEWLVEARLLITGCGVFDPDGHEVLLRDAPPTFEFDGDFWHLDTWTRILVWSWPLEFAAAGAAIGYIVDRHIRSRDHRRLRQRARRSRAEARQAEPAAC